MLLIGSASQELVTIASLPELHPAKLITTQRKLFLSVSRTRWELYHVFFCIPVAKHLPGTNKTSAYGLLLDSFESARMAKIAGV